MMQPSWRDSTKQAPVEKLRVGYVKAEFDAVQDEEPRKIFNDALEWHKKRPPL